MLPASLYLSYAIQRQTVSYSYGAVNTLCPLDSLGVRGGSDRIQRCASGGAGRGTAQNRAHASAQNARCVCQLSDATGCVGSRARSSAAAPDYVIATEKRAMIAMQLTCPDLSSRQAPERLTAAVEQDVERFSMPADKPATVSAQSQSLDPGIVSEAIPEFGAGGADARLATVRRFCISALMVVAAGVALVAIMALKIIAYLPRFH
jgi:hypothetical protein